MKIEIGKGKINAQKLALFASGELYGAPDTEISFICTDSREADENTLFVAIRGERVDGHDYIGAAVGLGCRCVLCEHICEGISEVCYIKVKDSVAALSDIAKNVCADEKRKTVAITGSVGKTTTKELVFAAIASENSYKTEGNFNSVIGSPLSMLEMPETTDIAVLEMGMSGFSEIECMSRAAMPDIAIITNIGSSHLEMLGTRENIRKAKLEITAGLKNGGILLVNGDDPMLASYDCGVKTLKVGMHSEDCDFRAVDINESDAGSEFTVIYPDKTKERFNIALRGYHNVYAALFGCAAAELLGIDRERVKRGLPRFGGVKMRQNIYELGGVTVIEDCYNASPESMRAAISVASNMAKEGSKRFVALLGDMKELGADAPMLHREVGAFAAQRGLELLVSYGELAKNIADGAEDGGVLVKRCDSADADCAASILLSELAKGDLLLVKASRSMKAENVIEIIKARMEINDNV